MLHHVHLLAINIIILCIKTSVFHFVGCCLWMFMMLSLDPVLVSCAHVCIYPVLCYFDV